jgi:small-conductance mechanosensitive channel
MNRGMDTPSASSTTTATLDTRKARSFLARLGFLARGVLYVVIGLLAIEIALGHPATSANQAGALRTVAAQPFGHAILLVLAVGLAGYVLWRATQAVTGRGVSRQGRQGAFTRIAAAGSAVGYTAVFLLAVSVLTGTGRSSGSIDPFVRKAMRISPDIVIAAGAVTLVVAAVQLYKALRRPFMADVTATGLVRRAIAGLGVIGYLTRAALFGLIGYGLVAAGRSYSPHKAIGVDRALIRFANLGAGPALMIAAAAGLIAFGLFSALGARYFKV